MEPLSLSSVRDYVETNITEFHKKKLDSLNSLSIERILKKKNPYLYRCKNILTSEIIVRTIVDAFLSSSEETIFGDWLENLAIFVNHCVYGGWKSTAQGIDLEFDLEGVRQLVAIKSGPNWGNSDQIRKMIQNFSSAKRSLRTSNSKLQVNCVNGCCYGKDSKPHKKEDYFKYCGQDFWHYLSGNKLLYIELVEPLGHQAKQRTEEFEEGYSAKINLFTNQFTQSFCTNTGQIDWEKFLKYNSGAEE
ncbi:MAG: PmeII family type II restriction endonuclease [Candidatus Sumerlaeia bacterium]|nr:PmeII family type II restriction endonuclease [Candidatus Sumerlaeia bacterium]